jgi:predicted dehydrogenase
VLSVQTIRYQRRIHMSDRLSWGILGLGRIAGIFVRGVAGSETARVVAVGSRSDEKAHAFASELGIPKAYGSYEALLGDPSVDVVYIATPHSEHMEWTIRAAEAGKHILCEKPIAMNHAQALAMVNAARRHDVFLMEAFMYRCHPQVEKLAALVRDGAVGKVGLIQVKNSFQVRSGVEAGSRLFNRSLGGGGILDIGPYPVSLVRLLAGAALGRGFADPLELKGTGVIGEFGVDETAVASLRFEGGILGQICSGIRLGGDIAATVIGSEGSIIAPNPWNALVGRFLLTRWDREGVEEIVVPNEQDLYALEADTVAAHIRDRQAPAMTWDDTLGNAATLDRWLAEVGMTYDLTEATQS